MISLNLTNLAMDRYELKARTYTVLLLITPATVLFVAFFSTNFSVFQSIMIGIFAHGIAFLFAQIARDFGKRKEKKLFKKWDGIPSVAIFRHRDQRLNTATKRRYHEQLSHLVNSGNSPTKEQEELDPISADEIYNTWSDFLRSNTRNTEVFSLLFQENVNYGYRRNIWGIRPLGIFLSLITLLTNTVLIYCTYLSTSRVDIPLTLSGIVSLIFLALWLFQFSMSWVKVSADAYAERLAECTDVLSRSFENTK